MKSQPRARVPGERADQEDREATIANTRLSVASRFGIGRVMI